MHRHVGTRVRGHSGGERQHRRALYIHGVEGAQGTVTLTATAPRLHAGAGDGDGRRAGLGSVRVPDIDDDVVGGFGVLREHRGVECVGQFLCVAAAAAGAASVTVTVSHSNTAVGQLVTTGRGRTVADGDALRPGSRTPRRPWRPAAWPSTRLPQGRRPSARRPPGSAAPPVTGDGEFAGDDVVQPARRRSARA